MKKRSKRTLAETRELIRSFRGMFKLKPGEKSVVQEHLAERRAERLKLIRSSRGSLKGKLGDKPFAEWWAEQKTEERELEERRSQRLSAMIRKDRL